ncbi:uncharacterized protein RAG0_00538 [Rhynchosporium agropyri]|uniref:Uncharacterized protein n=1 Tax=Rhynchosporium agropyri TaxID=914238 RepID=A0A1E1JTD3_9HELO|nr:uncharacterized protein RAG0_00538 [Rhynchosporium agropyri]
MSTLIMVASPLSEICPASESSYSFGGNVCQDPASTGENPYRMYCIMYLDSDDENGAYIKKRPDENVLVLVLVLVPQPKSTARGFRWSRPNVVARFLLSYIVIGAVRFEVEDMSYIAETGLGNVRICGPFGG